MNNKATLDKKLAGKFYKTLRDHFSQREEGRQVIAAFEADPDRGGANLAQYLRRHLPQEKQALADQIARSFSQEDGSQFVNLVTGGHVDQILNFARVGVLQITIKKYFYLFSSLSQVVVTLTMIILVSAGIAYGLWRSARPAMDGGFNIAVAKFAEESNITNFDVAGSASETIFSYLDDEYKLSSFEKVVVHYYDRIRPIQGSQDAAILSRQVNAHLVIYGDVTAFNDQAIIAPKFYVTEAYESDAREMSGEHSIELPVPFSVTDLANPNSEVKAQLPKRIAILTDFTKGLVYSAADDVALSLEAMEDAMTHIANYQNFPEAEVRKLRGVEVIYLLASNNARLLGDLTLSQEYVEEAFDLNENYGRAYIALGNNYYDNGNLFMAEQTYQQAAALEDQPDGAYVVEKASVGLCNIYTFEYQNRVGNATALPKEREAMAQDGLTACQVAIDSYEHSFNPDNRLTELAAWSHYNTGIIYQFRRDFDLAQNAFEQALDLTMSEELIERANRRLGEVKPE